MTAKHENRVKKLIREQTDRRLEAAYAQPATMRLQNEIKRLKEDLAQQSERVVTLINQVNHLQDDLDNAEKRRSIDVAKGSQATRVAQENAEHFRSLWKIEHEKANAKERAHKKASAILRLLSPDKYHALREDAANLYPDLFTDDARSDVAAE